MRKQLEWVATPFSVQATSGSFVDDNRNGDDEKSVHGVSFEVVLLSCMLPIITYYRPLSMPIISYSRIL